MLEFQQYGANRRQLDDRLPLSLRSLTIWVNGENLDWYVEGANDFSGLVQGTLPNLQEVTLLDFPKGLTGEGMKTLETLKFEFAAQGIAFHY